MKFQAKTVEEAIRMARDLMPDEDLHVQHLSDDIWEIDRDFVYMKVKKQQRLLSGKDVIEKLRSIFVLPENIKSLRIFVEPNSPVSIETEYFATSPEEQ
jgi:hypothetical protein